MTRGYHTCKCRSGRSGLLFLFPTPELACKDFAQGVQGGWRDRQFIRIESFVNLLSGLTLYGTDYGEVYA